MRDAPIMVDADEMIATPLKPKPCDHQVLDATLGAIKQHRCAVATLKARKLEQRSTAKWHWAVIFADSTDMARSVLSMLDSYPSLDQCLSKTVAKETGYSSMASRMGLTPSHLSESNIASKKSKSSVIKR